MSSSPIAYPGRSLRKRRRRALKKRDGMICQYCGKKLIIDKHDSNRHNSFVMEHVIPLSRGGTNDLSNLVAACRQCDKKKNEHTCEELGWSVPEVCRTIDTDQGDIHDA